MLNLIVALIVAVFCLMRAASDFRQRKHVWGTLGILAGVALVATTPVPTHAEKIDLPPVSTR